MSMQGAGSRIEKVCRSLKWICWTSALGDVPGCSASCLLPGTFRQTGLPWMKHQEGSIPWSSRSCPCVGIGARGDAGVCICMVAPSLCLQGFPRHLFGTGDPLIYHGSSEKSSAGGDGSSELEILAYMLNVPADSLYWPWLGRSWLPP